MDYPVSGSAPNVADAMVPHIVSGGVALPVGPAQPMPVSAPISAPLAVVAPPNEVVSTIATTSGKVYSSGQCIGGAIALSGGGFVSGATYASDRDLSVSVAGSQGANITATFLRGTVSTASTVADGSATVIAAADASKVAAQFALAPNLVPGAGSGSGVTLYQQQGVDKIVPSGGYVVLTAGSGGITVAASSGVTIGTGVA